MSDVNVRHTLNVNGEDIDVLAIQFVPGVK